MINFCDTKGCKSKGICVVYNTLARYQQDISVSVNGCKYCSEEQSIAVQEHDFIDPVKLKERTNKIKQLSYSANSVSASQTVQAVRRTGMKFSIDDREVS